MNLILARKLALPVAIAAAFVAARAVRSETAGAASAKPAESVRVLREVPQVERPPAIPRFSAAPSSEEIRAARVFGEPIVALGVEPNASENEALAKAVLQRLESKGSGGGDPVRAHLERYPDSPYRASLLLNLAMNDRREGAFTRATAALEEAWRLTKSLTDPDGRAIAERAIAELGDLHLRFGSMEGLAFVMSAIEGRNFSGASAQKLALAREGYSLLLHHHEDAIPSARTALQRYLRAAKGPDYVWSPRLDELRASHAGANLLQVRELSRQIGEPLRIVEHDGGEIPVPSVVHLRTNHYSAIVREEKGRYLLDDPCLGGELWVTREVLLAESSGFFFVPESSNPAGFHEAVEQEAALHRGKCYPLVPDPDGPKPDEPEAGGNCTPKGLAQWGINKLQASLHLSDVPVGYTPPRGPSVDFRLDYHHREKNQPALFSFSNVGPLWGHRWLAYLEDDPSNPAAPVAHFQPGGGVERWFGYDAGTGAYAIDRESRAQLVRISASPVRYERRLPDGSVEVFEQPDGAATSPRRVFRTAVIDPQGNGVAYTYDSSLRLVAVTDAIGQVTTLAYEHPDPLKITKITDPFGRFARLDYDSSGRLVKITDVIGLESKFEYEGTGMIAVLETPYGRTSFSTDPFDHSSDIDQNPRWVEVEDPLGGRERVEYRYHPAELASTDPIVPFGFASRNVELDYRVTFYWDKRAMSLFPGDLTKAEVTKWLMAAIEGFTQHSPVAVPHNIKKPLENRVWYAYPNQTDLRRVGSHTSPSKIARVLDDGQTQVYSYEYNNRGKRTLEVDPLGRSTRYTYAENGIDLLQEHQLEEDGTYSLLRQLTYNSQHQVLTARDAAGQVVTYTYLPTGEIASITTPERLGVIENRTTYYNYSPDGYLASRLEPDGLTTWSFTYDSIGREATATNLSGVTLTFEYDELDRVTRIHYPDGSYEETVYERLDNVSHRDRMGRWSHRSFDALRRVISERDANGQVSSRSEWVSCSQACNGAGERVSKLVDGRGNSTYWEYDLQGRMVREVRSDATTYEYSYEDTTSRMRLVVDPNGSLKTIVYNLDDTVREVAYTEGPTVTETANVAFTYDRAHNRIMSVTDGEGTTTYTYVPASIPPTLGAGRIATIDGPFPNDVIQYSYDEIGRIVSRSIDGPNNVQTIHYDYLGRPDVITNLLGSFVYAYSATTRRLVAIDYPNGQTSEFSYYGAVGDWRLQEIHHRRPDETTLSRFGYTYDRASNVISLLQQFDQAPSSTFELTYDSVDQIRTATQRSSEPGQEVLRRYAYVYDEAGNRRSKQVDEETTSYSYNSMNQLTAIGPGGYLVFSGNVDEPATLSIDGVQVEVQDDGTFANQSPIPAGTGEVTIAASDFAQPSNLRTNTYELTASGPSQQFQYDLNGNRISDAGRSFEWDAENRLAAVQEGTVRIEYRYDGYGRNIARRVLDGQVELEHETFVRCDVLLCEVRDAAGSTVKRRPFLHGEMIGSEVRFATRDLVRSIRDITEADGSIVGRFDYEPYGVSTTIAGNEESLRGYTGHEFEEGSGLMRTHFRLYDPKVGAWLSEDRVAARGADSLYRYVLGNPLKYIDPDGARGRKPNWEAICIGVVAVGYATLKAKQYYDAYEDCGGENKNCNDEGEARCDCNYPVRSCSTGRSGGIKVPDCMFDRRMQCYDSVHDCCSRNIRRCALQKIDSMGVVEDLSPDYYDPEVCTPPTTNYCVSG